MKRAKLPEPPRSKLAKASGYSKRTDGAAALAKPDNKRAFNLRDYHGKKLNC